MIINNVIDFYDVYITQKLKDKMNTVNANWIFCPVDLAFSFAKEKFGQDIFPLYTVFRNDPFTEAPEGSISNFRRDYTLDAETSVKFLNISLNYQIDFFSNNMNMMNSSNIDYYKKLRRNPKIDFNFEELDLDYDFESQIRFSDEPISNNNINNMFNNGRYFRYTYNITSFALYFDITEEVTYTSFIFSIYEQRLDTLNLLKEMIIPGAEE